MHIYYNYYRYSAHHASLVKEEEYRSSSYCKQRMEDNVMSWDDVNSHYIIIIVEKFN